MTTLAVTAVYIMTLLAALWIAYVFGKKTVDAETASESLEQAEESSRVANNILRDSDDLVNERVHAQEASQHLRSRVDSDK